MSAILSRINRISVDDIPDDLPVFSASAKMADCWSCHLDSALSVEVCACLFDVAAARKNNIGYLGALVAVVALVYDKGVLGYTFRIDLVRVKEVDEFGLGG